MTGKCERLEKKTIEQKDKERLIEREKEERTVERKKKNRSNRKRDIEIQRGN